MRKNHVVQMAMAAVLLGVTAVIGGCSGVSNTDRPREGFADEAGAKPTAAAATTPPTAQHLPEQMPVKPEGTDGTNGGLQTASGAVTGNSDGTAPTGKNVAASSDKSVPGSKSAQPTVEAYSVKKPSLMGISLTDNISTVTLKLGKPEHEYTMDEEEDPIVAYEYSGFVIGFNKVKLVQFVEITSNELNPGLNGFKLGQSVKDAVQALGKPDTSTKYAMSYKSGGTILKLDVDPTTQNILSIKLFAETK